MNRMLEALQQIEAKSPDTRPAIKPVSSEELEAFGLRPPADPQIEQTEEAPQAVQPVVEEIATCKAPEVAKAVAPKRDIRRPLDLLVPKYPRQFRQLANNIVDQLRPDRPAALMFTSPGDAEGEANILAPLAVMLAERIQDEIVAVDGNFHNPRLASHLGIWADRGLVDVLIGAASWREVVRKTSVARLSVLPGGRFATGDGCPPESIDIAPLLDDLRSHYQLVLLETASLVHPEVAPVSRSCDGTYLVIQVGQTPRRAAQQAVRVIEDCGGRLLGCVLTNVPVDG